MRYLSGLTRSGAPLVSLNVAPGNSTPERLGTALEIVLLMTLLSLAPALVMTMTCFTRIIIVLSFLKRAMDFRLFPELIEVRTFIDDSA